MANICDRCHELFLVGPTQLCAACIQEITCRDCGKELRPQQEQLCDACLDNCVDCGTPLTENEHRLCTFCLLDDMSGEE